MVSFIVVSSFSQPSWLQVLFHLYHVMDILKPEPSAPLHLRVIHFNLTICIMEG